MVSTQFDIDWVRIVLRHELQADGPTDADLVDLWRRQVAAPDIDLDAELLDYTTAQAFVDDCADQFGVTFDAADWCEPRYYTRTDDGDFADGPQLRFEFWARQGGDTVHASVDLAGYREPVCELQPPATD